MSERVYQVTHHFLVRLYCDKCEAEGELVELKPDGVVFKKYQHICPKCRTRKLVERPYPIQEYKLVEVQQVENAEVEVTDGEDTH